MGSSSLKDLWQKYLDGHWQKEMPTKPGRYQTATQDGLRAHEIVVMIVDGELTTNVKMANEIDWAGWWWSEPTPPMPKPPAWQV